MGEHKRKKWTRVPIRKHLFPNGITTRERRSLRTYITIGYHDGFCSELGPARCPASCDTYESRSLLRA
jgi:hypothetical protein